MKLRYKAPDAPKEQGTSKLLEVALIDSGQSFADADADFRFAASVAGFGMLLRDSPYAGDLDLNEVATIADESMASGMKLRGVLLPDTENRLDFVRLVHRAAELSQAGD